MAKLEVVLPLALLGVSVWWFRAISHPIVLDKRANELSYTGRRESLVGARAVAVRLCDSSESTDHYEIEIVYGDRRVTVGVATWTCETVRERAEERAARIAAFLGLPVGAAPAA